MSFFWKFDINNQIFCSSIRDNLTFKFFLNNSTYTLSLLWIIEFYLIFVSNMVCYKKNPNMRLFMADWWKIGSLMSFFIIIIIYLFIQCLNYLQQKNIKVYESLDYHFFFFAFGGWIALKLEAREYVSIMMVDC